MLRIIDFLRTLIRITSSVKTDEFGGYIITRPRAHKLDEALVDYYIERC
jgi:hypothetical protein